MEKWNNFLNNLENLKDFVKEVQPDKNLTEKILKKVDNFNLEIQKQNFKCISFIHPKIFVPITVIILILLGIFSIIDKKQNFIDISFSFRDETAYAVSLLGDFNNWDREACKLTKNPDGIWKAEIRLKSGRYQYQFMINEKKYLPDPQAKEYINDGYGNKNSILDTLLYAKT